MSESPSRSLALPRSLSLSISLWQRLIRLRRFGRKLTDLYATTQFANLRTVGQTGTCAKSSARAPSASRSLSLSLSLYLSLSFADSISLAKAHSARKLTGFYATSQFVNFRIVCQTGKCFAHAPSGSMYRCQANVAHIRQSRPYSGPGF